MIDEPAGVMEAEAAADDAEADAEGAAEAEGMTDATVGSGWEVRSKLSSKIAVMMFCDGRNDGAWTAALLFVVVPASPPVLLPGGTQAHTTAETRATRESFMARGLP
jgi:hypothetical protein